MKIKYKRNKHQAEYHNDTKSKLLHMNAGFGSGKTYALAMKALQLAYLNKGLHGGLLVPDYADFKRDVLLTFEEIADHNRFKLKYNNQEHTFTFPFTKGKLYIVTAEKKLRGANWAYALGNEITLCPLTRYKELIGRVRIKDAPCPQIATCGTPEGFANEYYNYFVEKPPESLRIIYGSTLDNKENLGEDYITSLEQSYDSYMLNTFLHGQWVNITDNKFYYCYDAKKNDDPTITRPQYAMIFCSLDFNVDPFCATFWYKDFSGIYAFDQIKLTGGAGFNTENMIQAMQNKNYTPQNTIIYPDPAGQARSTKGLPDVEILRRAGYQVNVRRSQPRIRERQINVNNLLERGVIKINPDACAGLKADLLNVEQDPVTLEKVKKVKSLTHFSDGMDYLIDIEYPFTPRPNKVSEFTTIR